jgi:hypothetical protein
MIQNAFSEVFMAFGTFGHLSKRAGQAVGVLVANLWHMTP